MHVHLVELMAQELRVYLTILCSYGFVGGSLDVVYKFFPFGDGGVEDTQRLGS